MGTVDDSGARADHADGSGHARPPAASRRTARPTSVSVPRPPEELDAPRNDIPAGQDVAQSSFLSAYEHATSSKERNDWTLRLLLPVLAAILVTVLGVAVIVGIMVSAGAWWNVASGLGLAITLGVGTLAAARRPRRPRSIQLPKPRAAP